MTPEEKNEWYNLEDRENYDFACYVVITEDKENRNYTMIDDFDDAIKFKTKCECDKRYSWVSAAWKINKKTNNVLMGVI